MEAGSFWFRHRNECILRAIARFYGPGGIFFDIGGGNGFTAKALQDRGYEAVLVEPGPGACNAARRGVKNVICSALEDIDLKGGRIPAAGLFDVLEHTETDVAFLKYAGGLMEKGGLIFITVPAHNFLWSAEDADAGHYRRYGLGSIAEKVRKAGFKPIYSTYYFGFLIPAIFFLRTIPSFFGFKNVRNSLKERKAEHMAGSAPAERVLDFFMKREERAVTGGKSMFLGASCLIVAEKVF